MIDRKLAVDLLFCGIKFIRLFFSKGYHIFTLQSALDTMYIVKLFGLITITLNIMMLDKYHNEPTYFKFQVDKKPPQYFFRLKHLC